MSDIFTKRRPMIDLDEFERRLCRPCSTDQKDGDPLAELLRIIGGKDESHETDFEPKYPAFSKGVAGCRGTGELNQPDAHVRLLGGDFAAIEAGLLGTKQPQAAIPSEAEGSTVEYERPNARAPLISGDFAAIEAGLLGASRGQATATVSETDMSNAFSSMDIGSQRSLDQDNQPASRHAGVADGQNRSRRPLNVMVAIVIVAMAGIAVGIGLKSRASGPPEIASIKAESGAAKQQGDTASGADAPAQDAAILSKPPEPSPMALDNGTEQPSTCRKWRRKRFPPNPTPKLIIGRRPCRRRPRKRLRSRLAWQLPSSSEEMKTDLVRPDGTLSPNAAPPQANINEAPLPAPQSAAAAKAPEGESGGPRGEAAKTHNGKTSGPSWPSSPDCEQGQGDACEPIHHGAGTERRSQGRGTGDPAKPGNQWGFRICAERCEFAHQRHRQVTGVGTN